MEGMTLDISKLLRRLHWNESLIAHYTNGTIPGDLEGLATLFLYVPDRQDAILARLDELCNTFDDWADFWGDYIHPKKLLDHIINRMMERATTIDHWLLVWDAPNIDDPRTIEAEGRIQRLATSASDWEKVLGFIKEKEYAHMRLEVTALMALGRHDEAAEAMPRPPKSRDPHIKEALGILNAKMKETAPSDPPQGTDVLTWALGLMLDRRTPHEQREAAAIAVQESRLPFRAYRDFLTEYLTDRDNRMIFVMFSDEVFRNKAIEAATTAAECLELLSFGHLFRDSLLLKKLVALAMTHEHWLEVYRIGECEDDPELRLLAFNNLISSASTV